MMELYAKKACELSHATAEEDVFASLSYLSTRDRTFLAMLLKKHIYEFTPIEVGRRLQVTNRTVINRCAKLAGNGSLQPMLVKQRIRSYRATDYARTYEQTILKFCENEKIQE